MGTSGQRRKAFSPYRRRALRQQAIELRSIGLGVQETAEALGISRTSVFRLLKGVTIPLEPAYEPRLTTQRARTVWTLMQREQARTRKRADAALERRIARAVVDAEGTR